MNVRSIIASVALFSWLIGCGIRRDVDRLKAVSTPPAILYVDLLPTYDHKKTAGENQCLRRAFLFPNAYPQPSLECAGAELANDDSLLTVSLKDDKILRLNSEPVASLDNLRVRLSELFESRKEKAVLEPDSDRVIKAVGIDIDRDATYGELINVVRAVSESNADPIVLLLDTPVPIPKPRPRSF